jgi:pimeloyl-ACP methyl ester carboxylesterase
MPLFQKDATSIYYEIRGTGFPLLLLPPGGMRAGIDFWQRTAFAAPEIFAQDFRVIALDERHSGRSSGPIPAGNPWDAYLADHLGLLNHLGIEKCLVLGCCMGASQVLRLLHAAPQRIAAAVLEQPTAVNEANRQVWSKMWAEWADELLAKGLHASRAEFDDFRKRMWADEFVMSVTREAIAACRTPLLVLPGIDLLHPGAIGHEIARLAPNVELLEPWKEPAELVPATVARIRAFLHQHTPKAALKGDWA